MNLKIQKYHIFVTTKIQNIKVENFRPRGNKNGGLLKHLLVQINIQKQPAKNMENLYSYANLEFPVKPTYWQRF